MKFSLNKDEKLFLMQKYNKLGLPMNSIQKNIKEVNNRCHELTIELNKKKKSKEYIKERIKKDLGL